MISYLTLRSDMPFGLRVTRCLCKPVILPVLSLYILFDWYYRFWCYLFKVLTTLSNPLNVWNLIFSKRDYPLDQSGVNHESRISWIKYLNIGYLNLFMYVFPIIGNFFSQMNEIVKYETLKITNLNDYSNYVFDRYLVNGKMVFEIGWSKWPRPAGYEYQGIELEENDGYMEYLAKKDIPYETYEIDQNSVHRDSISPLALTCPFDNRGVKRKSDASLRHIKRQDTVQSLPSDLWLEKETDKDRRFVSVQPSPGIRKKIDVLTLQATSTTPTEPIPTRPRKTIELDLTKRNSKSKKLRLKIKRKSRGLSEEELLLIIEEIKRVIPRPGYDDGSLAPVLVRLAWHCCATYDKETNTGGSNGATMRFIPEITDEGNNGLDIARAALEPIKQAYPNISYSDLWTLAGKVAIESMKGPHIEWKKGRIDHKGPTNVPPNGRLPFGDKDANHIRTTFARMGFNDQEAVVLLGCHAIGRCHKRISGWEGRWTQDPLKFSNEFFKNLIDQQWTLGAVPETGKLQYYNHNKQLMMLITDYQLLSDERFMFWVRTYADDESRYFKDFSTTFSKLLELGMDRDSGI